MSMSNDDFKALKARFDRYDESRKDFAESHDGIECAYCHTKINPGDDIVVGDCCVYCDYECFSLSQLAYKIEFNENDDSYYSWFPEK